jgi:hypothetical protein
MIETLNRICADQRWSGFRGGGQYKLTVFMPTELVLWAMPDSLPPMIRRSDVLSIQRRVSGFSPFG